MLTEVDRHPAYYAELLGVVEACNGAIEIVTNQTHQVVKTATEEAEIALVLSKWREPFGRTAIEAHAGGAALISSGSGGLREVSADTCLYVDPDDEGALIQSILKLGLDDAFRRNLAAAAHERTLQNFEIRRVSAALDDVYDQYWPRSG